MSSSAATRTAVELADDGGPPWRCGVGLVVLNAAGETLFCQRAPTQAGEQGWQWPQGGRDEGESPLAAAWRELYEEVGLTAESADLVAQLPIRTEYLWPDYVLAAHRAKDGPDYVQKYRGQKHDWFVFRLKDATDAAFSLDHHAEVEFVATRWVAAEVAAAETHGFRKAVYRTVCAALGSLSGTTR